MPHSGLPDRRRDRSSVGRHRSDRPATGRRRVSPTASAGRFRPGSAAWPPPQPRRNAPGCFTAAFSQHPPTAGRPHAPGPWPEASALALPGPSSPRPASTVRHRPTATAAPLHGHCPAQSHTGLGDFAHGWGFQKRPVPTTIASRQRRSLVLRRTPGLGELAERASRYLPFLAPTPSLSLSADVPRQSSPRSTSRNSRHREAIENEVDDIGPAIAGTRREPRLWRGSEMNAPMRHGCSTEITTASQLFSPRS